MLLTKLINVTTSPSRYRSQKAGFLQRHPPIFSETAPRQSLAAIAQCTRLPDSAVDQAHEAGWNRDVDHGMADGIITRDEEERLRAFRDSLALENSAADQGALARLDRAGADRVMPEARLAAISVQDGEGHLRDLALSIRQAGLGQGEANRLLIRAWETAVEGALEDGLLSLDEENALAKYAGYFSLTQQDLDQDGVQTSLVQAAVIRDVTQGIIPRRQLASGHVPFNLMKSEQLVWVIQGIDYLETVVRRERRRTTGLTKLVPLLAIMALFLGLVSVVHAQSTTPCGGNEGSQH